MDRNAVQRARQPRHCAAGNIEALALQLSPDLAHAIYAEVLLEHAPHLDLQVGIAMARPDSRE